jgi:ribosomal protein S18 acetylase RimI-like enzyme
MVPYHRAMESRAFSTDEMAPMLDFASRAAAGRPEAVYLLPGDIVWRGPSAADVRIWYDDVGLAGYGWYEGLTGAEFDLRPHLPWDGEVAAGMIDWAEGRRRTLPEAYPWLVDLRNMEEWAEAVEHPKKPKAGDGLWLTAVAYESDTARVDALLARGFEATGHFEPDYRFDLGGEVPEPVLPAGYRVRHVTENDLEERVATHRDAWVGSRWTMARYVELRKSPAYDADLDLVVEGPDGSFASCCICWADQVSGMGKFEPVGARPGARGKGATRAMIHEGFRRLKAKGIKVALEGTAGFNHPAQALYEGAGYVRTGTKRTFMKRLG